MTNYEIARTFERIGDILEIQGENPFKIKAYRKAAETIDELAEPLADIDARGGLDAIPGFGAAIVQKTRDFLQSGTTKLYEQIKNAVPDGVLQMAAVSGVGPKTAKALWDALQITSVDELETAAKQNRVQTVPGFGASKEKNLIEAIERSRRLRERLPLYVALPYAERLVREILARPEITHASVAGSLRRGRDTVGDLDLVAATTDAPATAAAFLSLPGINEAIEQGEKKVAALCDLGLRVDLRLGTPEAFVPLLHHFSSGREHNRQLREWAETKQLKINEYGVFDARTNAEIAGANKSEADLYGAVGLPFIAPEMREGRGEVEAAQNHNLPELITEADFRGQLHCHSTYSDGSATVREMAEEARRRGYSYIAITDHSQSLIVANGLSRARILQQLDEIAALNAEYAGAFTVLSGQEVDILANGDLDGDDDILARLDVVVGSVHIRHKETEKQMTERICLALQNPHLDILGHPTGRLLGRREPFAVDMEAVFETARETGTVLEINAAPERMDLNDTYARRAKEVGVKLSINSDAHSVKGLGLLPWGLLMARRAGLTKADVVNMFSLPDLRAALKGSSK